MIPSSMTPLSRFAGINEPDSNGTLSTESRCDTLNPIRDTLAMNPIPQM